ncbi:MAG: PKD domain-containing protein, partial [Bacteroidota bacterium]
MPKEDSIYHTRHPFKIVCASPPEVGGIKVREATIEVGQNVNFSTLATLPTVQAGGQRKLSGSAANWHFQWDYGDEESLEGSFYAVHKYERNGQYQVKLTVTDTSSQAFCSVEHVLDIKVGQDQAYLPLAKLHRDSREVLAIWSWGYYLLLGGLGIALLYYWLRWLVNRPDDDQQRKAESKDQTLYVRFKHSDQGPYYIPFRNQDQLIQTSTGQLRLADAMRLRQEGLRKEINIKDTLKATLNQGGFPQARFRYASQATEYLILVDEQNQASHLGHLFKYLAKSLQGEDVNIDVYYYHKHFTRFWNPYFPQGLDLDQLHRSHGHYKLIVMGDLHEMIDPFSRKQPNLRPVLANVIRQWSQCILLTPTPPISWTYREKLLARIFNIFPADTAGLNRMATHLKNGEELLPDGAAFDRWKELQTETRQDEDTEYRKWKRWHSVQDYFRGCHPDVERWFKALAVFSAPSWPVTLAIGHALGIQITYDKLLQLARIPTLQQERFDEKLRQKLLSILDPQDEKLARQALQEELAAVKNITTGSHATQELETCLAMQTFALEPLEEKSRDAIRFLLRENLLTRAQEMELDSVTDNHLNSSVKK